MAKNLKTAKDRGRAMLCVKLDYHQWVRDIAQKRSMKIEGVQDKISDKCRNLGPDFFLK